MTQAIPKELHDAIHSLPQFIGPEQFSVLRGALQGEEQQWFARTLADLAARIGSMPKVYEQDGKGDEAIAYLHYFKGAADFYITEKDSDPDGEGQIQAFGLADYGYGAELGYISIKELLAAGVEIDLHFDPATLRQIKESRYR